MLTKYFTFSVSITFISWIVGMFVRSILKRTAFYKTHLQDLNFIKSDAVNKMIGLGIFKWIVKNTFFKFFNQKLKVKTKIDKTDLIILRDEMTFSEIDHLIGFGFVTVFAFVKVFNGNYWFALMIMLVNLLMNMYPSLLQQENKRRIDYVLNRMQRSALKEK